MNIDCHYRKVIKALERERLIPFFGAGVHMLRQPEAKWTGVDNAFLPNGTELADFLARTAVPPYPSDEPKDLTLVSQYYALQEDRGGLDDDLKRIFCSPCPSTIIHDLFAKLPHILRQKEYKQILMVTTNFDHSIEDALKDEKFEVVSYVAEGPEFCDGKPWKGRFVHLPPGSDEPLLIDIPNKYQGINIEKNPVILKIHGTAGTAHNNTKKHHGFVITEDDYIDFCVRDPLNSLPMTLLNQLYDGNFLFLGYSLRDWNMRIFLRQIMKNRNADREYWAVQLNASDFEKLFWAKHNVDIINMDLKDYIAGLERWLSTLRNRKDLYIKLT